MVRESTVTYLGEVTLLVGGSRLVDGDLEGSIGAGGATSGGRASGGDGRGNGLGRNGSSAGEGESESGELHFGVGWGVGVEIRCVEWTWSGSN